MINNYRPPQEMQEMQIWTLCLDTQKTKKLSEYNASKKKMPLLTWPGVVKRFNNNPTKYSGVVGIVSDEIVTIDVDDKTNPNFTYKDLPNNVKELLGAYSTWSHRSFSGSGYHLYYNCRKAISGGKKCRKYKYEDKAQGEVMQGMFITTSAYDAGDFSEQTISKISRERLAKYIPEVNKSLQPTKINGTDQNKYSYVDPEKLKREATLILEKIPIDPDHLVRIVFETKLIDAEFSPYNYWLTVCQGLAHLAVQLTSGDATITEFFADLFHRWSSTGQSYKGKEECYEKFYGCISSTTTQTGFSITFDTLRKIAYNYKIPLNEFTKLKYDSKGKCTGVDNTDPRNFRDVINHLQLRLVQSSGNTFVCGSSTVIQHYFSNKLPNYLTDDDESMSLPFSLKYRADDDLANRLIVLFREMGIDGVVKSHPLCAGFQAKGIEKIDLVYNWMAAIPWDKKPRIKQIIKNSLSIDTTVAEEAEVPKEFYHHLVLKHLIHMAGLRAKAYRFTTGQETLSDSFKKAEGVLIIGGYQKKGKSTWVESLMPYRAFTSLSVTPAAVKDTLEMQRALTNTFIYNIDEIDAVLDHMDPSEFKSVITQEKDSFRTMYSQGTDSHIRVSGFFGTTNSKHLRLDKTGNRRIWIIPTKKCDALPFFSCNYQQVWAELLHMAEELTGSNWGITDKESMLINKTARIYSKTSAAVKMLDMQLSGQDKDGNELLYSKDEMDFKAFFIDLKQMGWRRLNGLCLFAVRGQKAYKHIQTTSLFNDDVRFSLKSFNYEIAEFSDAHLGFENETVKLGRHIYKDGIVQLYTGKPKRTHFHFIPYKEHIDVAIADNLISASVLYENQENKIE